MSLLLLVVMFRYKLSGTSQLIYTHTISPVPSEDTQCVSYIEKVRRVELNKFSHNYIVSNAGREITSIYFFSSSLKIPVVFRYGWWL